MPFRELLRPFCEAQVELAMIGRVYEGGTSREIRVLMRGAVYEDGTSEVAYHALGDPLINGTHNSSDPAIAAHRRATWCEFAEVTPVCPPVEVE